MSQKRSSHTEKLLKGLSKRAVKVSERTSGTTQESIKGLKDQYNVIREDILKLREDLQKGYDMAKGAVEKKSLLGQIFKAR